MSFENSNIKSPNDVLSIIKEDLHNDSKVIVKFTSLLSQKVKKSKAVAMMLNIRDDTDIELIKKLKIYCNYELDLSSNEGNYFVPP